MKAGRTLTRADLERHLAAMVAALEAEERDAPTPALATTARLMREVFPCFMRAFNSECSRKDVQPRDLVHAVESLVCNLLDYIVAVSATEGHKAQLLDVLLDRITVNVHGMLDDANPDRFRYVTIPRTRAS